MSHLNTKREYPPLCNRCNLFQERIGFLEEENDKLRHELEEEKGRANLYAKLLFASKNEKNQTKNIEENTTEKKNSEKHGSTAVTTSESSSSESKEPNQRKRGAKKGHKGYGRKIHDNLPVYEEIIELSEEEACCHVCSTPLKETNLEEVSSEISFVRFYYVKKIKRKVYKKTCNCSVQKSLTVAPFKQAKLIPKGKFSIEFWVEVLINKYTYHTPVERQLTDMASHHLNISSGTIFNGFKYLYNKYIIPLYEAMMTELIKSEKLKADETGWSVFQKIEGKSNFKWFMWVFISENIRLFAANPSRGAKVPLKVLFDIDVDASKESLQDQIAKYFSENKNYARRTLNADRYSAYKVLQKFGLIIIAYCWAHQRRDFLDIKTKYPNSKNLHLWVDGWLGKISKLYYYNKKRLENKNNPEKFRFFKEKIIKIISSMQKELHKSYNDSIKEKLMKSMRNHWDGLTIFVENPDIPMDNNESERTIKYPVLGRKNYWGNHAEWAAYFSAAMFSIIQTSLMHEIQPRDYMIYYFKECLKLKTVTKENISHLLPHKIDKEKIPNKTILPREIFGFS